MRTELAWMQARRPPVSKRQRRSPYAIESASALRAEARFMTNAGLILLAIGLPLTMTLTALALAPHAISPIAPLTIGGPPVLLGYIACHYASMRFSRAKAIEDRTRLRA